jgi:alanine racemase
VPDRQIKRVGPGEYVGYGLTFRANRPLRLAVLPIGYTTDTIESCQPAGCWSVERTRRWSGVSR